MAWLHSMRGLVALVSLMAGSTLLALQPAAPDQGTGISSTFIVFFRTVQIGREDVVVARSSEGWTITSSGRTAAPVDLTAREVRIRYTPDWKPIELTLDATLRGQAMTGRTTVTGNTAHSVFTQGGQTGERSATIAADAVLLPNPMWGPFEALAQRLRAAAPGSVIPAYALQSPLQVQVGETREETFQTTSRTISARRTTVTLVAAGPPVPAEIWSDQDGHLLRISIPGQNIEVVREDIASVAVRHVPVSRPGDVEIRAQSPIGFTLAGTLSKPQNATGRLPAVILAGGAGPTDRDETVYGVSIFGQLAHALADSGFLVVRYDKRGVGQSGGRPESAGLSDYASDLSAVTKFVRNRDDVDRKRIALVGHDEGGLLAMLASRDNGVAAIALIATMGVPGHELNMWQVEHHLERSSLPDDQKKQTLELQQQIQRAVRSGMGWDDIPAPFRSQADTIWFRSFLMFNPAQAMKSVRTPVLVLQGMLDTQVPPSSADHYEKLAADRNRDRGITVVRVPGVNHLLVPAVTGEVDEYPSLRDTRVSPAVIEPLVSWLRATFAAVR